MKKLIALLAAFLVAHPASPQFNPPSPVTPGYAPGGGTAQAQTATYSPAITLTAGRWACWIPSHANTDTAPTFSPNGLTAHTIVKAGGIALVANDLTTTAVACAIYDTTGTHWELQNPQTTNTGTIASGTSALGTSAIASAACATVVTTSATGVLSTDAIAWNPNASIKAVTGYVPATTGGLTIAAYPTANNVNFDVCNWTSSSITPGALTLNWRVSR